MTLPAIPHTVIIRSFFWPYSAEFIAAGLRAMFHQPMTAARLKDLWTEESAWNPFLRMDRPRDGFKQTDEIKFWERLAASFGQASDDLQRAASRRVTTRSNDHATIHGCIA